MTDSRPLAVFAVFLLAVSAVAGVATAGAPTSSSPLDSATSSGEAIDHTTAVLSDSDSSLPDTTPPNSSDGNSTNESTRDPPDDSAENGTPTMANQSRLSPVRFDREYLSIEVAEPGQVYNITGSYAVFGVSEQVVTAKIPEPRASARVTADGQTVRVEFEAQAAPNKSQSLYHLQLFFPDESRREVTLYASETSQIVAPADLKAKSEILATIEENAEESGFDTDAEGLENYFSDLQRRAELFSDLFGPFFVGIGQWLLVTIMTPEAIIFLAILASFPLWRIYKSHGWKITSYINGPDLDERKRQEIHRRAKEGREAAKEEHLASIDEIGPDKALLWNDAFDIRTTKQLADLALYGRLMRDEDGNVARDADGDPIYEHNGIEEIESADSISDTWLQHICKRNLMGTPQDALVDIRRATERMIEVYKQPQYREARIKAESILNELTESGSLSGLQPHGTAGSTAHPTRSSTGGDD